MQAKGFERAIYLATQRVEVERTQQALRGRENLAGVQPQRIAEQRRRLHIRGVGNAHLLRHCAQCLGGDAERGQRDGLNAARG